MRPELSKADAKVEKEEVVIFNSPTPSSREPRDGETPHCITRDG